MDASPISNSPSCCKPAILLGLFIVIFTTILWLVHQNTYNTRRLDLINNAESVAGSMRLRLKGNQDYLLMLAKDRAQGTMDATSFQDRASRYVADHPEMINITWVDADFFIRTVAPLEPNRQILGLHLDLPEPKRVSQLARQRRQPVYTGPFEAIQGRPSFEVWVPVFNGDTFLGLFGGVYSCDKLLHSLVHPQTRKTTHVSLVDDAGKKLWELPGSKPVDEKMVHQLALTPPESGLLLRFNGLGWGTLGWILMALEFLCLVLAFGVAYALWGLKRQVEVRKLAEKDREKLQTQLLHAKKMESVGRLAGGVAHDFNNMLGVILGRVDLALAQIEPSHPLFADLHDIQHAAEHSANLTRQLLAFARKQPITPKWLDLNNTVAGMLKMLRSLIGENIDLGWIPGAQVGAVRMDPSQIEQILANLCINARDAITGIGKITIETRREIIDTSQKSAHPSLDPGNYALLAVSDTGCGMDKETLTKIFEPFFTTKKAGEGTGLGLATVYGIVKQNNGFINVYSEPGKGTTFKIHLPHRSDQPAITSSVHKKLPPVRGGHETILLVEDDPFMLKVTTAMIQRLGYNVLTASTPGEALRLAGQHARQIRLLITDVVMPEMNGRDLARNLSTLYPDIQCLFMSGYTGDIITQHGLLDEGVYLIEKPFSMQTLAAKVREVLDQNRLHTPSSHP